MADSGQTTKRAREEPPSAYQMDLDLVGQFEVMLTRADAGDPDDVENFAIWAKSERVRVWVLRHVCVDMDHIAYLRDDYFRAPLFVAYHRSCEVLNLAGHTHANVFLATKPNQ